MRIIEALAMEYEHETALTRKTIERVPEDKYDWKPHHKSMSARSLASHLAAIQGWAKSVMEGDGVDIGPGEKAFEGRDKADILGTFDTLVADSLKLMKSGLSDEDLMKPWTLSMAGRKIFEMPRVQVLRAWVLNHQIHHRAQLTVYLRLLDVPVPSIYGPSADEQR